VGGGRRWRHPTGGQVHAYDAVVPETPALPRLTVALTFDHDSLSDSIRRGDPPVKLSHAEFGHRVGVPRILELLANEAIPSTWFVPGNTLGLFPGDTEAILAGGHELGGHGWFHEDFAELSAQDQASVLRRSFEALEQAAGAPPRGWRAPYWSLAPATLELALEAGFRYDSSLMADDYRPYRVRLRDEHSVDRGTIWSPESALLEAPVYWALDDWPHFEPGPGRDGLAPPSRVLEIWTSELRYAYEHAPGGLLTVTMHPECIGRGHRMAMLEAFLLEVRALPGVEFARLDTYLDRWVDGEDERAARDGAAVASEA
jgi:peptidoglycan/xylan/chitin deacetylase (PgdA/CDA1 family)